MFEFANALLLEVMYKQWLCLCRLRHGRDLMPSRFHFACGIKATGQALMKIQVSSH